MSKYQIGMLKDHSWLKWITHIYPFQPFCHIIMTHLSHIYGWCGSTNTKGCFAAATPQQRHAIRNKQERACSLEYNSSHVTTLHCLILNITQLVDDNLLINLISSRRACVTSQRISSASSRTDSTWNRNSKMPWFSLRLVWDPFHNRYINQI